MSSCSVAVFCRDRLPGLPTVCTKIIGMEPSPRSPRRQDCTSAVGARVSVLATITMTGGKTCFALSTGKTSVFYRNNGDGTFPTDVTKQAGLESAKTRWGAGCTFLDYDRDGHLDLFVSNYVQFDQALTPKPGENVYCNWKGVPVKLRSPRPASPATIQLYRNNRDGTFSDVSVSGGASTAFEDPTA